jgi:beta-galactosidase
MQAQVSVIVDQELCFWDASFGRLTGNILSNRFSLGKTGAPYDLYLRTDLEAVSTGEYRVIWLMGMLELTAEEINQIEAWQQQGVTVLWTDGYGTRIFHPAGEATYLQEKLKWSDLDLRELWKDAGVHVYLDTDDVFYMGRNWMCIHTIKGGNRVVKFPIDVQVINPLNQQIVADSTHSLKINLDPKSTILFRINSYP